MNYIGLLIFIISYAGIALGRIPGLAIDRTGVALLGAMAILVFHIISIPEAVNSVDYSTLILLFGLMLLSAQFDLGGFYSLITRKAGNKQLSPKKFMALLIFFSGGLSALLSNDVICFALTPIVARITIEREWNPVPFLLALVAASNVGSAITIIGNPQNMFIGQNSHLDFAMFLLWCGPPSMVSLFLLFAWSIKRSPLNLHDVSDDHQITYSLPGRENPRWNRWQNQKAIGLTLIMMILFFTPIPREITILGIASLLLMSRKFTTSRFLRLIDWPLLVLFIALFILIDGFKASGGMHLINQFLTSRGFNLYDPLSFSLISVLLSNLVSNVPAVMLLMAGLPAHAVRLSYLLAITSTYAGNLIIIGSIANLIVIQQAGQYGIRIGFKKHLLWTTPYALMTIGIAVTWWLFLAWLI